MSTVREQLDEAVKRERELQDEYTRVYDRFQGATAELAERRSILGTRKYGTDEYTLAQAEVNALLSALDSYVKELGQLSRAKEANLISLTNLRRVNDDPEVLAQQIEAVNRARAAVVAEEHRNKAEAELPEAITLGQDLKEEYERLRELFEDNKARASTLAALLGDFEKREVELSNNNPEREAVPTRGAQERWAEEVKRLEGERGERLGQAREASVLRDRYQIEAINAWHAYEYQEQVVRNLKRLRDAPREGERGNSSMDGGLFVPLGERVT